MVSKILIMGAALLCCSPLFASDPCGFKLDDVLYLHSGTLQYQIKLNISSVCSMDSVSKRSISGIKMQVFSNGEKQTDYFFENGLWSPTLKRFRLTANQPFPSGCLKGKTSLDLDLKSRTINSLQGFYLNLKTGLKHNLVCL